QRPVEGDDSPRRHAADCRRELLEPNLCAQFRDEHEKTIEIIRRILGADFGRWKRLPVGLTYVKDGDGFDSSGCGRVDLLLAPSVRAHASGQDHDPLLTLPYESTELLPCMKARNARCVWPLRPDEKQVSNTVVM